MKIIPVILSGGVGARLWPVSRESHPKPFIQLSDGQSLLQKTFSRALSIPGVAEILTVTNRDLYFKTKDEYRAVNAADIPTSYILEPFGRNTAPAVTAAAEYISSTHGEDALMLVMPADHLIDRSDAFIDAVNAAIGLATQRFLVTFGVEPTRPETGFGYIEANGNTVLRFVEKPTLPKAEEFIASGRHLWNAGIFCFGAGTLLSEMTAHNPELVAAVNQCMNVSEKVRNSASTTIELDSKAFANVPDVSIDYGLMERSDKVAVVPCNIGWSDIGSWATISELNKADEKGNRTEGEVVLQDSVNCYVRSESRLVSGIGLENLLIIDTPDALLVTDSRCVQDVRKVVDTLKARAHPTYKYHRTMHRPWGTYTVLEEGNRFKIKRIEVKPGASLSLQMHHHRSEHWIVVSGMAKVTKGEEEFFVNTNESTYIPAGHRHRLKNPGVIGLVMIEVQSGEYLGEDDIVRFQDNYGRT